MKESGFFIHLYRQIVNIKKDQNTMNIKQSIRIMFRNKTKTYSLLNIIGLAVGISCVSLILLWVEDELTFDKFSKSENLYYAGMNWIEGGKVEGTQFTTSPLLSGELKKIAGVKRVLRVKSETRQFGYGENVFSEAGSFVDSTFFSIFDVQFIVGSKNMAFSVPQSVVISESMAAKFFSKENPVGKTLKMNNLDYQVTGVYSDIRKNSSFKYDWMVPIEVYAQEMSKFMNIFQWGANHVKTIVELESKVKLTSVNELIYDLIKEKSNRDGAKLFLYPFNRMHLYGDFDDGKETGKGYITNIRMFVVIGLIILLIACINFMNLATARSQKRMLEVGVRKTFGGNRLNLVLQFMTESALITFFAMAMAVLIIVLALPFYNTLIDKQLVLVLGKFTHCAGLLIVGIICCLLSGSYPAFYMSSFPPLDMLKRLKTKVKLEKGLRKGLVVFQFTVSVVIIICTMFIYLQIHHVKNRSLGMDFKQVLTISASDDIKKNFVPMKQSLLNTGMVSDLGLSETLILQIMSGWGGMNWPGKPDNINPTIQVSMVSAGMISTMGLELLEGRDFDDGMSAYGYMIVNEAMAEMMGDEGRIGGRLRQGNSNYAEIIGIVKNFVFNNMYHVNHGPVILWYNPSRTNHLFIRLKTDNRQAALSRINMVMSEFNPCSPFDYQFMDDHFNRLFHSEQFIGKLALLFAALAIFISCLGLFGLTAFAAEQRTREIGIRKVLGASILSINLLLLRSFIYQLLISFVIALPLARLIAQNWLNRFDYRIDTNWTVFAASYLLVLMIAFLTVSVLSWKAATANPVNAIKSE